MTYRVEPVGYIETLRRQAKDDFWGEAQAVITLVPAICAESLRGMAEFSHAEVLYILHAALGDLPAHA
jgi:tRNA (Thr-GGU) A37 N-methylase